ncbi:MAG TPA: peptidylprolyl isomerase [Phycisphaerae bacterium]|nr:peptidylprolyl isomerase [Phycisphaerae bacterium]
MKLVPINHVECPASGSEAWCRVLRRRHSERGPAGSGGPITTSRRTRTQAVGKPAWLGVLLSVSLLGTSCSSTFNVKPDILGMRSRAAEASGAEAGPGAATGDESPTTSAAPTAASDAGSTPAGTAAVAEAGNVVGAAGVSAASTQLAPVKELVVNGEKVPAAAILRDVQNELRLRAAVATPEAYEGYVVRLALERIRDRVSQLLLYQQGLLKLAEAETKQVDAAVDAELRRIITAGYGGSQRRYEREFLEPRGETMEDARREVRREIVVSNYLDHYVKPMVPQPTRAELRTLFEARRAHAQRSPQRQMSLIDVRVATRLPQSDTEPSTEELSAARSAARARAEAALAELRGGADFADVARRYSEDSRAADGGAWGWLTFGSVTERFEPAVEALFALAVGRVSDVIETPDSFFLVRCDGIEGGAEPDFEGMQPELKEQYFREAYNRLVLAELTKLQQTARIEPQDLRLFLAAVLETAPRPGGKP